MLPGPFTYLYLLETNKFQKIRTLTEYINVIKRLKGEALGNEEAIGSKRKVYRPREKVYKIKM